MKSFKDMFKEWAKGLTKDLQSAVEDEICQWVPITQPQDSKSDNNKDNVANAQLRNQLVGMVDQYIILTTKMNSKLVSDIEEYQKKVQKLQGKIEDQSITKDKQTSFFSAPKYYDKDVAEELTQRLSTQTSFIKKLETKKMRGTKITEFLSKESHSNSKRQSTLITREDQLIWIHSDFQRNLN